MALLKLSLLGMFLLLTFVVVSSATPWTNPIRRCNDDNGNVVVDFFHCYKDLGLKDYHVSVKYLFLFFVFYLYFLFLDDHHAAEFWSIVPLGRGPKHLLSFFILFYFRSFIL
ncbi:hypothetical protein CARUB_v10028223mg [Capsella rubella]|uniref:Uncharacterized protein n=1 Tax=Capsella rubella TaxID=81985 RepID=R0GDV5_9BRAS|nr:uncharacterized protein LOC17875339 [Capsella rubella]EOA14894.1 hypothetical protein CARUB_v10028223mg [Capsella rubella]